MPYQKDSVTIISSKFQWPVRWCKVVADHLRKVLRLVYDHPRTVKRRGVGMLQFCIGSAVVEE